MTDSASRHPPPRGGKKRKKRKAGKKRENRTPLRQRVLVALQIGSVLATIIKTLINW